MYHEVFYGILVISILRVVRTWKQSKEAYEAIHQQTKRARAQRGDMATHAEMEQTLYGWIIDQRDQGLVVSGGMIRAEAISSFAW